MTKDQLTQLVTIGDLQQFEENLLTSIEHLIAEKNKKEFYSPTEFQQITGMKYSTIIYYLNKGEIKGRQKANRGTWSIHHSEVQRFRKEAHDNVKIISLNRD